MKKKEGEEYEVKQQCMTRCKGGRMKGKGETRKRSFKQGLLVKKKL